MGVGGERMARHGTGGLCQTHRTGGAFDLFAPLFLRAFQIGGFQPLGGEAALGKRRSLGVKGRVLVVSEWCFTFHSEVAEGDGIAVAGEADVTGFAIHTSGFGFDAAVVERVEIGVEDAGAVEGDFDAVAADVDLLGVPLASRAEEAALGAEDVIDGAMHLVGLEFFAGFGFVTVGVDDLDFQAVFGAVTAEGGAQGDAVVAGGWELEFEAQGHVAVLFFGEQIAAFALFADDVAIHDFVVFDGALPVGEVFAVVEAGEAFLRLRRGFCWLLRG
jgi:hypothetical protein